MRTCRVAFIQKTLRNFAASRSYRKHLNWPRSVHIVNILPICRVAFIQAFLKSRSYKAMACLGLRSSSSMVVVTPSAILWDLTCSSGRSSSFQEQPLYSLSLYLLYLSGGEFSKFSSFVIAMLTAVVGLKKDIV